MCACVVLSPCSFIFRAVYAKLANPTCLRALIANAKEWAGSDERFAHPYKFELENFEPLAKQLELKEPQVSLLPPVTFVLCREVHLSIELQLPGSNEDTPLTFIDSLTQLEALKEELKCVKEFAIDLEVFLLLTLAYWCDDPLPFQHHSYRTFLGITCLMQISTHCHDYLIDTLVVRQHMHILLDPFTDPNIVKVLDNGWL